MKKFILLLISISFLIACDKSDTPVTDIIIIDPDPVGQVAEPCENGMAGIYPCNDYDLVSHINLNDLGGIGASGNDCWGWTDPTTQKEYALMCTSTGTSFIDISDPVNPINLGQLPTRTSNSTWRDVKTYGNYAFIVSEASNHGMQVFDLTRLRNIDTSNLPITFTSDANYTGFGNAHNIVINEANAYAYAVGSNTFAGGPHFVDISDPLNPSAPAEDHEIVLPFVSVIVIIVLLKVALTCATPTGIFFFIFFFLVSVTIIFPFKLSFYRLQD